MRTTSFLLQGGKSFEVKVAQTELMSTKDAVKNVIQTVITMSSLLIYCGQTKHNTIAEISLSTTKSLPLPII